MRVTDVDGVRRTLLAAVDDCPAFKVGRCAAEDFAKLASRKMYVGGTPIALYRGTLSQVAWLEEMATDHCRWGIFPGFGTLPARCLNLQRGGGRSTPDQRLYVVRWDSTTPALERSLARTRQRIF